MQRKAESFSTDITVHATAEKIWESLTTSSFIRQYLGTSVESDWHKGSTITYRNVWEGKPVESKGILLEIEPYRVLKQSYFAEWVGLEDKPENHQIITISLVEIEGSCIVTATIENVKDDFFRQRAPELWGELLTALRDIVENKA